MVVGVLVGILGAFLLVVAAHKAVVVGGIALAAVGGTITFVSGVAAGVANGMARHEYLRSRH